MLHSPIILFDLYLEPSISPFMKEINGLYDSGFFDFYVIGNAINQFFLIQGCSPCRSIRKNYSNGENCYLTSSAHAFQLELNRYAVLVQRELEFSGV